MRVNVSLETEERAALIDVSDDIEYENFKALCAAEFGFDTTKGFRLVLNGNVLSDVGDKALRSLGVSDNDLILVRPLVNAPQSNGERPGAPNMDVNALQNFFSQHPEQLSTIKRQLPALAEAIERGDRGEVMRLLGAHLAQQQSLGQNTSGVPFDPLDPSVQEKLYEQIRRENIEANFESAIEHSPESFGHVVMLYVNAKVNGQSVKAFIDSGAQMTIMSKACAERCNLMKLLDTRFSGIAKGIGVQKILGRIHLCQLQIGNDFLQCTFSVLEDQEMDFLLGLDMLRRHQCSIDLKRNALIIGTTGTETPFLPESELPHYARLNYEAPESDRAKLIEKLAAQQGNKSVDQSGASTSSASQSQGRANSASASGRSESTFPEAALSEITKRGFTREEAARALADFNGDSKKALANLLVSKLGRSISAKGQRK